MQAQDNRPLSPHSRGNNRQVPQPAALDQVDNRLSTLSTGAQQYSQTLPSAAYLAAPQSQAVDCGFAETGRRHFSPLEIIDQTDDDAKLLQALEGLTLDDSEDGKSDTVNSQQALDDSPKGVKSQEEVCTKEHGTRSEFIQKVAETLITRVNSEASGIDEAKQLMQNYMLEFCNEYDRCGYGKGVSSNKSETTASSKSGTSDNLPKIAGQQTAGRSVLNQGQSTADNI